MPPRRRGRVPAAAASSTQPPASDQLVRDPQTCKGGIFPSLVLALSFLLGSFTYLYLHRDSRGASPVLSVYDRGLVKPDLSYQEIIRESAKVLENRTDRHFPNPVLAYITPWSSRGYEMAKLCAHKFTHLSPVWYDLKSEGENLILDGQHNADMGWIAELRTIGHSLVLPRVVLEAFPADVLQGKQQRRKAIDIIISECKDKGYDGIVLESWSRWAAYGVLHDKDLRTKALLFIKELGQALHSVSSMRNASQNLELVYVIPAPRSHNLGAPDFGPHDLQQLSDSVDGFSLMTYDFSSPQNPGPNAPLQWIAASLQVLLGGDNKGGTRSHAHKIFVGINYYGNDFILSEGVGGGGAITGNDYISLLAKHKPKLEWGEKSGEHFFVYAHKNEKHAVFYPTPLSISLRLDEVKSWGASLSIWEIGQGLDYFFDLL